MRRSFLPLAGFVGAALAATAFSRRGSARRRERADLYFADGSMLSLSAESADAQKLLPVAREALRAARSR